MPTEETQKVVAIELFGHKNCALIEVDPKEGTETYQCGDCQEVFKVNVPTDEDLTWSRPHKGPARDMRGRWDRSWRT